MGRKERTDDYFRKRLKRERERRDWSQAAMAKMMSDNGIPMHATTIAKIEAGDRAVRIDEATGIAELFRLSLDGMLGRKGMEDDESHALTVLAGEAQRLIPEVSRVAERLRQAYGELEAQFDFAHFEQLVASGATWSLDGMSVEWQRAMMMWACRDMAILNLHKVLMGLVGIVGFRSMTPRELVDHVDQIKSALAEHGAEWRAIQEASDGSTA